MAAEAIWLGFDRSAEGSRAWRHCHDRAQAALVLAGGYGDAGDRGRVEVAAGDVVVHGRFESHQNVFGRRGATFLVLPCPPDMAGMVGRVADPDEIAKRAERDLAEATAALLESLIPKNDAAADWPDLLARALDSDTVPSLAAWAEELGVAQSTLSRGFALAYGVSPQRFRADRRACRAARAIGHDRTPLAALALDLGFADQAHMSREVARLTGLSPRALRRAGSVKSVQEGGAPIV